jgi:hypothetical protein
MAKNKIAHPIWKGIDTTFLPKYYIKNGKEYETKTNKQVKDEK